MLSKVSSLRLCRCNTNRSLPVIPCNCAISPWCPQPQTKSLPGQCGCVQVLINSKGLKMDPFQSLYYVSPACMMCLVVPFFIVELPGVRAVFADPTWTFRPAVFLANAFAAFLLNLAVFLLIGKTSALTMNIAGVIKDWTLIYSSYSVFKAPVTALNLAGVHIRILCAQSHQGLCCRFPVVAV